MLNKVYCLLNEFYNFCVLHKLQTKIQKLDIIENISDIIARLRKEMYKQAEALNFEEASRLRDKIKDLERLELSSDA